MFSNGALTGAFSRLFNEVAHAAEREIRNRLYSVPNAYKSALGETFGVDRDDVERIKVTEYSDFAKLHGKNTLATTRRNAIYLRGSGTSFIADDTLVLHEYYHVIRQWNVGALTVPRYLWESFQNGYWDNRYEVEARDFSRENAERFRNLLEPK